ncbi:hypothetical protein SPRG_19666 [Saprolegnia parasitica CBS 223.65]|uniref:RING-type domain-containing protein n=1 Tax=Saprolegnia parasitica (strain CBS 223.65) TaxID=695850 RepID=A0A067CVA8_SAPPC|nr:hypothetical protein SPRG_19666 [Saprolegnia parasitica CBS 223.65]KDO30702.1 hypothetical protein SPRG_19666 [Saprolegnia parasitica CBS 223.65]|eukprot:XP_012198623.1 hypothetical protein SPRG_19666 [Saprolegnia parasitica CBS 223.65]
MATSIADLALRESWPELEERLKTHAVADVNVTAGVTDATALALAARHGQHEIVHLLLGCNDIDVDKGSRDRTTPLHEAAKHGHFDVCQDLIGAGADMNAKNKDGSTPLHEAAKAGQFDVVKGLLAAGANPQLTNKNGDKPFAVAKRMQVRELLRGRMFTVGECALHGKWNEVKRRITSQSIDNINEPFGARDWTLLAFTVWYNQVDLVDLLLGYRGIDINQANMDGMTPLHEAAKYTRLPILAALLRAGADTSLRSNSGLTAMDMAAPEARALLLSLDRAPVDAPSCGHGVSSGVCKACEMVAIPLASDAAVTSLKQRIRSLEEASLCCICMERCKDTVFACGHETCMLCSTQIVNCPNCRDPITTRIRRFV